MSRSASYSRHGAFWRRASHALQLRWAIALANAGRWLDRAASCLTAFGSWARGRGWSVFCLVVLRVWNGRRWRNMLRSASARGLASMVLLDGGRHLVVEFLIGSFRSVVSCFWRLSAPKAKVEV